MSILIDNSTGNETLGALNTLQEHLAANVEAIGELRDGLGAKVDTLNNTAATFQTVMGNAHASLRSTLEEELQALGVKFNALNDIFGNGSIAFFAPVQQALVSIKNEIATMQAAIQAGQGTLPSWMEERLSAIGSELTAMKETFVASHQASEAIRAQAETAIAANQQQVQEYLQNVNDPPEQETPIDPYPFDSVPEGTTVRDLPDGGRLFGLPTGDQIRVSAEGVLAFIGVDGEAQLLAPALGREVTLPNGMTLELHYRAMRATHEAAMIEGLPLEVEAEQVGDGRYILPISNDALLSVNHIERTASIFQLTGTVILLSQPRIEGFGEKVDVRILPGGLKAFECLESEHRGVIDLDGTIHLACAGGLDLVIRFPEPAPPVDAQGSPVICEDECGEDGQ